MLNEEIDVILFEDEAMIRDYQAIGKTWFQKGKQRIIPTYGKHQGVKLLGTLDYASGKIFCVEDEKYDAKVYLSFLEKVLAEYPNKKIALIQDNARIHHAKLLQPFYKANEHRLEVHFLPPYSPNLNCIEEFWGWLKRSCIHNVFYKSTQEIRSRVQEFISKANQDPLRTVDRLCLHPY